MHARDFLKSLEANHPARRVLHVASHDEREPLPNGIASLFLLRTITTEVQANVNIQYIRILAFLGIADSYHVSTLEARGRRIIDYTGRIQIDSCSKLHKRIMDTGQRRLYAFGVWPVNKGEPSDD
jgi:hypothetical protein